MKLDELRIDLFRIPTDRPEADGTASWDSTTMLLIRVRAQGLEGLGYSYASSAAAQVVREQLEPVLRDQDLLATGACWQAMVRSVRNAGRPGIGATAISAVDVALWDLKAKSLQTPLFQLLGPVRQSVPIYGSGGFTSYSREELVEQLAGWVEAGIPRVKMKIGVDFGTRVEEDCARIEAAREAIGTEAELFIDANGAYTTKTAIWLARRMEGVASYFEEPVSSDQLDQLAHIRASIPQSVAAGEYGYDPWYFNRMLRAEAVDIIQADATRCLGVSGFLAAAHLAEGFGLPFSAHTSPTLHAQIGCAARKLVHVEYFHDHVRIENMLFDGVPQPDGGQLAPPDAPGLGLELRSQDAARFAA